jgi:hypothetical protein
VGDTPPEFGDPASIGAVGEGAEFAAKTLEELARHIEADIRTLTGWWSGEAADAWQRRAEDIQREIGDAAKPADAYKVRIAQAGETMRVAQAMLQQARAYAAEHNLFIGSDFRVIVLDQPNDPTRRAQAAHCQRLVDAARQLAAKSRHEIATANTIALGRLTEVLGAVIDARDALRVRAGRRRNQPTTPARPHPPDPLTAARERVIRQHLGSLHDRIDRLNRHDLMDRLQRIDPRDPDSVRKAYALRRDVEAAEDFRDQTPSRYDGGLSDRPTPGGPVPRHFDAGNFVHRYADQVRNLVAPDMSTLPPQYAAQIANRRIISISELPPGLQQEVRLGETARVDRLATGGGMIYELKPATPEGISEGLRRLEEYERLATSQRFGGTSNWSGAVVVYDPTKAAEFVRDPSLRPRR